MAGWLHGVFVVDWLFVFPLCGFSLSLFCNYARCVLRLLCSTHSFVTTGCVPRRTRQRPGIAKNENTNSANRSINNLHSRSRCCLSLELWCEQQSRMHCGAGSTSTQVSRYRYTLPYTRKHAEAHGRHLLTGSRDDVILASSFKDFERDIRSKCCEGWPWVPGGVRKHSDRRSCRDCHVTGQP